LGYLQALRDTNGYTQEKNLMHASIAASLLGKVHIARNTNECTCQIGHSHANFATSRLNIHQRVGDINKHIRERNLISVGIARSASTGHQTVRFMSEYTLEKIL